MIRRWIKPHHSTILARNYPQSSHSVHSAKEVNFRFTVSNWCPLLVATIWSFIISQTYKRAISSSLITLCIDIRTSCVWLLIKLISLFVWTFLQIQSHIYVGYCCSKRSPIVHFLNKQLVITCHVYLPFCLMDSYLLPW